MIRHLSWRDFSGGLWLKGPREHNPAGTLRRAKSVYPLRTGSVRSRSGMHLLAGIDAHSLFKAFGRRIAGFADQIYREVASVFTQLVTGVPALNGNPLTFVAAPPNTGVQDYVFVAGGGNLFKINPALDTASKWGIAPPAWTPPVAAAGATSVRTIDAMDATTGWSASVIDEDDSVVTGTFPPGLTTASKRVEGTASLRFKIFKDKTTRIDKAIAINLNEFAGPVTSSDEDYIELYVAFNRPKHVKNMEVVFYVGSGAPNFDDEGDTYSREFTIATVRPGKKKKLIGTGDLLRKKDQATFLANSRLETADFSTAEFVAEDRVGVTRRTWTRLTIPKASFTANGNAGTTFTWADVQGIRISVETTKLGASRCWVDRIRMIGGVGMQGDYQYMFTLRNSATKTRSNPFPTTTDAETGATVFAPVVVRNVERQPIDFTTLQTMLPQADTQVDEIEVWRTVGNGTSFFLAERVPDTTTAYSDRVADYPGMFSGGGGTKFLQPEELPDDNDRPDDTLREIVGPVFGRMWLARGTTAGQTNRAWYSGVGRLESVSNFAEVGGTDEEIQRFAVWNETLFAVTKTGLYRLQTNDEPFIFTRVAGAPGTRFPGTVVVTDAGIVYQANDGIRLFDGAQSGLIGDDALAPVFRGGSTDGLSAFSGFASVFGRDEYYVSDNNATTLAYSPSGGWRNIGVRIKAFFWEADTRIMLATAVFGETGSIVSFEGDANGEVGGLVAEATTDIGLGDLDSDFELETAGQYTGAGVWGTAQRIYVEGQTEAQNVAVSLIIDNTAIALGNISTAVGIKRVMEAAVHRAGWIQGVRLTAAGLTKRIEISAIEVDVYVPPSASG